jgi:glucose-6-phosphate isomerase
MDKKEPTDSCVEPIVGAASTGCWTVEGRLLGDAVQRQVRTIGDLGGVFADEAARAAMDGGRLVYEVELYLPEPEGTLGGLFWGTTRIAPGRVGDEYFMTKGHFHRQRDRAEYYRGVSGEGVLILMDEQRRWRAERMRPGSLHYIPGFTAHRVANTGEDDLLFEACWPADAGHDYATIADHGFSVRLLCRDGKPVLQPVDALK